MRGNTVFFKQPLNLLFLWEFRHKSLFKWIFLSIVIHGFLFVFELKYPAPKEPDIFRAVVRMPIEGTSDADRIYAWAETRDPTLLSAVRLSSYDIPLPAPQLYEPSYDREKLPLIPYPQKKDYFPKTSNFAGIELLDTPLIIDNKQQITTPTKIIFKGELANRKVASLPEVSIQTTSIENRGLTRFRVAISPQGIPLFILRLTDSGNLTLDNKALEHLKNIRFTETKTITWGDIDYIWGSDIYKK